MTTKDGPLEIVNEDDLQSDLDEELTFTGRDLWNGSHYLTQIIHFEDHLQDILIVIIPGVLVG